MFQKSRLFMSRSKRWFASRRVARLNDLMKTLFRIFIFLAVFNSSVSLAEDLQAPSPESSEIDLPLSIVTRIELAVSEGTCEASWREKAAQAGVVETAVDAMTTLYLVPCAFWTHNWAWMAFARIAEFSRPDGYLTLPMLFVDYSSIQGPVARNVLHNIVWDPLLQTISSRFFLNGKEDCGSAVNYQWDSGQRSFTLKTLLKQDESRMNADNRPGRGTCFTSNG